MTQVITDFANPAILALMRIQIGKQLADFCETAGISVTIGKITYNPTFMKVDLQFAIVEGGVAMTEERDDYSRLCLMYGLKAEWLDEVFNMGGHSYQIVGLIPRRPKYPVLVLETDTGKRKVYTAESVKRGMEAITE